MQRSRDFVQWMRPPRGWMPLVIILGGTFCGIGLLTVHLSNATSYLSDDPRACINCHVMIPQYASWERGSHARVATCNDCHVPHDHIARTYYFKAMDGSRHAYMFTFRLEPQVIKMHEAGQNVVQENCIRCHEHELHRTSLREITGAKARHGEGMLCWECHRETPHGRVNSLASVEHVRVPSLSPALPEWLHDFTRRPDQSEAPARNPSTNTDKPETQP
ncbi:MAG: cytochrome c nitrite reductase small subunit [Opitutales bacterium]|nr:cytochrome c nitrite reductase small subunit [Opitutales bacterium]